MNKTMNLLKSVLLLAAAGMMLVGMVATPAIGMVEIDDGGGTPVCCSGTHVCAKADGSLGHYWGNQN